MTNKIQELTDKIYQEGVEKGQAEAKQLIEKAKEEAEAIVAKARKEAEDILNEAHKKANETTVNTQSELKMYAAQAINALKSEIASLVTNTLTQKAVASQIEDKEFLNQFMLELAKKWSAQESIIIETSQAKALTTYFAAQAKDLLQAGVTIKEVNGQKASFVIKPVDGAYKIEFGETEFENYFKAFLRPQLVETLFN